MAATVSLIQMLAAGCVDSTGTPIASGKARFYQPGTLTPVTAYSNTGGTTAITPPLTLTAGGTGTAYTKSPTRLLVKDSTDVTTLVDVNVNLERAESTYIQNASVNGGTETTLDALLTGIGTSFGGTAGLWKYKAPGASTERTISSAISTIEFDVKDFGCAVDGATDDTANTQTAINAVQSAGGGTLKIPPGTLLISSALSLGASVRFVGAGRGATTIKQSSTTADAISLNSAQVVTSTVENLTITASTTSTGAAIKTATTNTNDLIVSGVEVATGKFAYGIRGTGTATVNQINITRCQIVGSSTFDIKVEGSERLTVSSTVFLTTSHAGTEWAIIGGSFGSSVSVTGTGANAIISGGALSSTTPVTVGAAANSVVYNGVVMTSATPGSVAITDSRAGAPIYYALGSSSAVQPLPLSADSILIKATAAITVTVSAINATGSGRRWTLMCSNASGGAVTWTFNAQYVLSAAVAPATGNRVNLLLEYSPVDGKVYEIGRAATAN